jgi:hypothetical protein
VTLLEPLNSATSSFLHYNFARNHKSLSKPYPTTPAMAAGVANHVWTLEEIAGRSTKLVGMKRFETGTLLVAALVGLVALAWGLLSTPDLYICHLHGDINDCDPNPIRQNLAVTLGGVVLVIGLLTLLATAIRRHNSK